MILKTLTNKKNQKLSKLISDELGLGYNQIQKIIRNKDVKVSGKRISKDVDLIIGDFVEIFLSEKPIKIVYEDDDVVVVEKPRNIETICESSEDDLITKLSEKFGGQVFAVHRLDRNTSGLVIFAKNEKAKYSLDRVIKDRKLEKFYLAKVVGVPQKSQEKLVAYLKKDAKNSRVFVSDKKQKSFEEIKTNYKVVEKDEIFSILEVELVTGKTHQIRAHLSHIGFPILGDEKYGNFEINKKYKKKYQCLSAYKLIFHFEENDYLYRLNGLVVELDKNEIDFLKNN